MALLRPIETTRPLGLLAMDYLKLPRGSSGLTEVLTVVDYATRYVWAFPVKGPADGASTVQSLQSIFDQFGGEGMTIMSDNGSHFTANEVTAFVHRNGARLITSPNIHHISMGYARAPTV